MRVGSEWHLLSSRRLEQAVYEHHPSDNADANADANAARHGVSLCTLRNRCALAAVRTAAAAARHQHVPLDEVGVTLAPNSARKVPRRGTKRP
jgi:hypothetical protein